ncbi:MAG: hypothetical protein IJT02_07730 [Synergistaceae bacterium]|nr:hypothetical protein [Synergistaceae bacterium]
MSIIARLLSKIVYRFNGVIDVEKTERYKFQLDVFRASPRDDDVIVMLGDSLTENTPFNELLHFRFRVKNRGISSDNTCGVLARIDEAANNLPEKMFILLGTNDIGNGIPLSESMSNYREIIRRVRALSPRTKIYVQSVLPVDHKKLEDNVRCRRRTREAIAAFNTALEELARDTGCEFLDTHKIFNAGDGEMDATCTADGLHLNGTGMLRWCGFLEQYM